MPDTSTHSARFHAGSTSRRDNVIDDVVTKKLGNTNEWPLAKLQVVDRATWVTAREELLVREKVHTLEDGVRRLATVATTSEVIDKLDNPEPSSTDLANYVDANASVDAKGPYWVTPA